MVNQRQFAVSVPCLPRPLVCPIPRRQALNHRQVGRQSVRRDGPSIRSSRRGMKHASGLSWTARSPRHAYAQGAMSTGWPTSPSNSVFVVASDAVACGAIVSARSAANPRFAAVSQSSAEQPSMTCVFIGYQEPFPG